MSDIPREPQSPARLTSLDALRGIAAIAVTWFHMTHGGELLPSTSGVWWIAKSLGSFGHHGVTLFFVLSGFVIPYTLMRGGRSTQLGVFMAKRLVRLQPPFIAACLLAIGLNLISLQLPGYNGPLSSSYLQDVIGQGLTDSLYITGLLGRSWILVVAWTLAIEVQFYLIAGLSKHLLTTRPLIPLLGIAILSILIPRQTLIFHWLPIFGLGALAAMRYQSWNWKDVALAGTLIGLTGVTISVQDAIVAAMSLTLVLLAAKDKLPEIPGLHWLGGISYSLYLTHVPIGGRIVNLASRISPSPFQQLLICLVGFAASIAAAWMFWRAIEVPSHRLSRLI